MTRLAVAATAALIVVASAPLRADEGMWTFHDFPLSKANSELKTRLDQAWLDRVRTSTVRIAGCTASFVSPQGLMLTNHHCVEGCLAELSNKDKSYIEDGFLAERNEEEKKCASQVADVLVDYENVTAKVSAATAGKDEKSANDARKVVLTQLESECRDAGKLHCQSVTLYNGGQYWLYKYKRYTDVRIVFAPEKAIASFGGDPDNFQFPRWCLDMGLLRVYENGQPVKPANYLRINAAGPAAGDPVFVSGHPGNTNRLLTVAQLRAQRNMELPNWLLRYSELRGRLLQFARSSPENDRISIDRINTIENQIKVRRKQQDALHEDALFARKAEEQARLEAFVAKDAALRTSIGQPWAEVENAVNTQYALWLPYALIENNGGFQGRLVAFARALVRGAQERPKPNAERFREFTDNALPRLEQQLGAAVPIYTELEVLQLSWGLERLREWLGPDHAMVRRLMSTESPEALARRLVTGSKLGDPAQRLALWKGGLAAINASDDPFIKLALSIEDDARAIRKEYEDRVEAPLAQGSERIARARFAALGTSVYPDATFTLRLNYGTVQGWNELGKPVEPFTKLSRLFERATGADPFEVPQSWLKVKDKLDPATPFNLSTNNDIVGGNSGSALINAKGEIVGLMFDGNIHSISGSYWFDTEKNRAVAVHPAIIREALDKVYGAKALLKELGVAKK
jgi:hypothetical protein